MLYTRHVHRNIYGKHSATTTAQELSIRITPPIFKARYSFICSNGAKWSKQVQCFNYYGTAIQDKATGLWPCQMACFTIHQFSDVTVQLLSPSIQSNNFKREHIQLVYFPM